jgi:hypothetical protein
VPKPARGLSTLIALKPAEVLPKLCKSTPVLLMPHKPVLSKTHQPAQVLPKLPNSAQTLQKLHKPAQVLPTPRSRPSPRFAMPKSCTVPRLYAMLRLWHEPEL